MKPFRVFLEHPTYLYIILKSPHLFLLTILFQKSLLFDLELFQTDQYVVPVARFPVSVKQSRERLYLQATVTNEPLLSTKAESCWLADIHDSSNEKKYDIIQNR